MKLAKACLSARNDRESRFHHCGRLVGPVPACLTGTKDRESTFYHCGVTVKLVQAC